MNSICYLVKSQCKMQLLNRKKLPTGNDNLIDEVTDCDTSFDGSWRKKEFNPLRMALYQLYQKTMEKY